MRAPGNALGDRQGAARFAATPVRADTDGPHVSVIAAHRREPGSEDSVGPPGATDRPSKHSRSAVAGAGTGGHAGAGLAVALDVGVIVAVTDDELLEAAVLLLVHTAVVVAGAAAELVADAMRDADAPTV